MATSYLSKTFGSAGTSDKIWTWSAWIKRSSTSTEDFPFSAGASQREFIRFETTGQLSYRRPSGTTFEVKTNRVFRDTSAWYHIVIAVDTTQATASDRVKMYVNGVQETSFATTTYPSLNYTPKIGGAELHTIGKDAEQSAYFNGSMTHIHFIDGTAYDADTFGETDSTTGIWIPKTAPSVTYGTNGFFLKGENSGSLGTDSSGNANNFTVNGTPTQTIDTPSNVFATYNATLSQTAGVGGRSGSWNGTLTNGNTSAGTAVDNYNNQFSTFGITKGKYYAEFKMSTTDNNFSHGIVNDVFFSNLGAYIGQSTSTGVQNIGYYSQNGQVLKNNSTQYTGSSYGTSGTDIISVALDCDNNFVYFAKNGTYQNSGVPTSGATGTGGVAIDSDTTWFLGSTTHSLSSSGLKFSHANFGNGFFGTTAVASAQNPDDGVGIFEHSVPTGYKALCTKSINSQEYN